MKHTFTQLKQIVYLTLSLLITSGNLVLAKDNSSYHYLRNPTLEEYSAGWQAPFSLSDLASLGQALSLTAFSDSTNAGKTYYWVPFGLNNRGGGAWSEIGHWATTSGGKEKHQTLPTAADDVVFDANSFLFAGQKVTVDVEANVKNISWVGIRSTTFEGSTSSLNVHGTFQANSNLLLAGPAGFTITFRSANPDTPINFLNKSFPPNSKINFEGAGGWILMSQLSTGQGSTLALTEGTLKTNNYNISVNTFRSTGERTRTLELGTSTMTNLLTWDVSSSLTLKAAESRIVLNGPGTHTFIGGDLTYRVVALHGPESIVSNSNTFKELSLPASPDTTITNTLNLESGQVQTIETLSTPGSAPYTTIQSSTKGSNATINFTSLGFCTDYLILGDVHSKGPGSYYAGLNSEDRGNNNGWHFITCSTAIYAPKAEADYDSSFVSATITSTGSNKWQEVKYNGELIGAIRDGGNALGAVNIEFMVSADSSRTMKNTAGTEIGLMPRNWSIKATNQPSPDKPVSIRLFGLKEEFEKYKAITNATALSDLSFTTYSSDSTENCFYLDNTAQGSTTYHIGNAVLTSTGNYFTAELTGITDLTELYLHNGGAAIDFVASRPAPPVVEAPAEEDQEEIESEVDPTNCSSIKLKWRSHHKSKKVYYEVEVATDLYKNDFRVIGKFQNNASHNSTGIYELKDSKTGQEAARYYRLKMYDSKGKKYYSKVLVVKFNCGVQTIEASPNPFTDHISLTVNTAKAGDLNIKLLSNNGKESLFKRVIVPQGKSETEIRIDSKMKPGLYYLFTELNGKITSQRILKK